MTQTPSAAERIEIERACERIVYAYSRALDLGDMSRAADFFAENGSFARPMAPEKVIQGREAIRAALLTRPKTLLTKHLATNVMIDVISRDEARGLSYLTMISTTPSGDAVAPFVSAGPVYFGEIEDRFVREGEDVDLYRDAFSPFLHEPEELVASAAVAPASTKEVQQIVRIANRYKVPLYPISTGRNLGYGGSAPTYSGSVVVDLKRMNRVIEVNEANAFALVEPGVSYFDLYRHIQERKLKVWIDCPDPGWGSVSGNALDHGGGYTTANYRNHFDSHCGMEIVLPNGELLRTGNGGNSQCQDPGSNTSRGAGRGLTAFSRSRISAS